jgi:putative endopeptidase
MRLEYSQGLTRIHPRAVTHRLKHSQYRPQKQHSKKLNPEFTQFLHANVIIPPFKASVKPGTDFYQHINGVWLQKTPIPRVYSSYGVSEEVEVHIQDFLFKELYECQRLAEKGEKPATLDAEVRDSIGRLALSALRQGEQKHSVQYLKRGLRSLGCMRDTKDLANSIGFMNRFGVKTILEFNIFPPDGGPKTKSSSYQFVISPGSLGLPDADYYSAVVPGKSSILRAYTDLIQKLEKELDLDDLASIIPLEAEFSSMLKATKNDKESTSEDFSVKGLEARFKNIPWETMFTAYGLTKEFYRDTVIHIDSVKWMDYINAAFEDIPLDQWYTLVSLHTLLHAIPYLPPPIDDWHHHVFERLMRGQHAKTPQDILTLKIVKMQMAPQLGYRFVKVHLTAEFKTQATQFVKKIISTAQDKLGRVEWFSAKSRRAAIEKLRAMEVSVGYSEPMIRSPPIPPPLQTDILLANIYLLESAATEQRLDKLRKDPPKGLWDEPPYTVNAYYYHETNEIVIPAGSFFWPFFNQDTRRWIGWNYGGLGTVIAHEITHAFDKEGKQYDSQGKESSWWSKDDDAAYLERTRALIRLYNQAKVLGRHVNGSSTLNENLADLGGLAIALEALKGDLNGASDEERKKQLRDFFVSYAVSWRTKEQPERRLQRLLLDKHAPVEMRVNLIVSQFDEWYEAFGVETGDALYIPPEERIRFF